ncbi:adenylate cyclase [Sinorhizobium sp. A49]|uniref:CYTH domain-containing protein n=1 Tax=Sinorhizobium sp. A49 TaxID=1945861 RepID=UPI0009871A88|nr:CYTH domain-containing protein [Sinorhizobium sp. A49]OOG65731.1 adenylate cyclase [Sinorhizobium sp. A49]
MTAEIERKFKVSNDRWRQHASVGIELRQAYIMASKDRILRVRTIDAHRAVLTVKIRIGRLQRDEYEYEIPYLDAIEMFARALGKIIEKTRHEVEFGGHLWEVDVYSGEHRGLVTAEVELANCDDVPPQPTWIGPEITGNQLYSNRAMAMRRATASLCAGVN